MVSAPGISIVTIPLMTVCCFLVPASSTGPHSAGGGRGHKSMHESCPLWRLRAH